jgi:hypothetical protein
MNRLVDMVAGGGWLLLALFGGQFLFGWNARRARNREIDRKIAEGNAVRAPSPSRQQRRAIARRQAKKAKA